MRSSEGAAAFAAGRREERRAAAAKSNIVGEKFYIAAPHAMRRAIRSLSRTTPALSRASAVSAGLPAQLPPRLSARSSSLLSLPQLPWSAGGTRCLSIAAAQQRPVPQLPKLQPEWIPPRDKGPLALNRIRDNFGASLKKTRVGRGIGTGRGRKSGRGNNGMRARAGNHGFLKQAGGQTNMIKRVPKKGFTRPRKEYCWVNLDKLQSWIMSGRLPAPTKEAPVTIKDLFDQKMITHRNRYSGIRLLGRGCLNVEIPMHIEAQVGSTRTAPAPALSPALRPRSRCYPSCGPCAATPLARRCRPARPPCARRWRRRARSRRSRRRADRSPPSTTRS